MPLFGTTWIGESALSSVNSSKFPVKNLVFKGIRAVSIKIHTRFEDLVWEK
jgi:hypothetical protein